MKIHCASWDLRRPWPELVGYVIGRGLWWGIVIGAIMAVALWLEGGAA